MAMAEERGTAVWFTYLSSQTLPQLENHSASLVDGHKIYVFGGNSGNEQYNTLFAIDTRTMLMEIPATEGALPRGRSAHTSTLYDQKLYILFGWGGTGNELHDLHCLDLRTMVWSDVATIGDRPCARHWQTASLVGNRLFVFAGYDGSNQRNDLYSLNLDTLTWTKPVVTGDIPSKRANHKAVVVGKYIYVIGGWNGGGACEGVYVLDTDTFSWTQMRTSGTPPQARTGCEATLYKNHIICFGGKDSQKKAHNDVYALNLETGQWQPVQVSGKPPSERMNTAGLLVGSRIIYIGGNCEGRKQNDVHVLDLTHFLPGPAPIPVPPPSLAAELGMAVNRPEWSDVTFIVEGRPVYAHRIILASRSEYFRAMFAHGMREARQTEIPIPDVRYDAFVAVMKFLYTDAEECDLDHALELLKLATMYALPRLSAFIEHHVASHLDPETVCAVFQEADAYACPSLRETCKRYMLRHFDTVSRLPQFLDIRRDLIAEILQSRIPSSNSAAAAASPAPGPASAAVVPGAAQASFDYL